MKPIHVIPLTSAEPPGSRDDPGLDLLENLAVALARVFRTPCQIRPDLVEISHAWDRTRRQHHSTAILQRLEKKCDPDARVLGVTGCDLFVPVLTFVFGEAQLEGNCAAVSLARLREEFYGLPAREELLRERLLKEAIHELGHTFGLRHCPDWHCAMASSYAVDRLDVKGNDFCASCRNAVFRERYW